MARGGRTKDAATPAGDGPERPGFEQSLERLEEIVAELEGSDVALERALALFEEGVALGRSCTVRLDEAERRITALLEQVDGSLVEHPFDADAPTSPAPRSASRARKPAAPRDEVALDDDGDVPF